MKTRFVYLFVSALFIASCGTSSTSSSTTTEVAELSADDQATLRNIKEVQWVKAYSEQDTILLDEILHPDFSLVDDNGDSFSKADELEYVRNYGPSYNEFSFQVESMELLEGGNALVVGTGTMSGETSDGAYITTYRSSNTFTMVDGNWKVLKSEVGDVQEETIPNAPGE